MGEKYIKENEDGEEHLYDGFDQDLGKFYKKDFSSTKETRFSEEAEVERRGDFYPPNYRGKGKLKGKKGTWKEKSGDKGYRFYPDESRKSSDSGGSDSGDSSYESSGSGGGGGGGCLEGCLGSLVELWGGVITVAVILVFGIGGAIDLYNYIFEGKRSKPKQEYVKREIPAKQKVIKLYNPLQQEKNIPKKQSSKLEELAKKSKVSENKSSLQENNKQIKTYKESLSWSENEVVRKSRINESKVSSIPENNKQVKKYKDGSKIYESLSSNSDFSKSTPKGFRPGVYDNRDENNNVISQRIEHVSREKLKESTMREIGITYPKTGNYYIIDKDKYPEFYIEIDRNKDGLISLDEIGRIQNKFNKIIKKYSEGDIESIVKDFTKK